MRHIIVRLEWFLAAALALWAMAAMGADKVPDKVPEYWPTCSSPQDIAPMQSAMGSQVYRRTAVAWNGKDYALAWVDRQDNRMHFQRAYADGSALGGRCTPSALYAKYDESTCMVWNGNGYAVAWDAIDPVTGNWQIYFAFLDASGNPLTGYPEKKVSFAGLAEGSVWCYAPALAYSGGYYAVAWYDDRNHATSGKDVFVTILGPDGSTLYHDLSLTTAGNEQSFPAIAWSKSGGCFVAAWLDFQSGTHAEIDGATLNPSTGFVSARGCLVTGAGNSLYPSLADSGNGLGMVWTDTRDGPQEIYFGRLSAGGYKIGNPDLRLTDFNYTPDNGVILWTGAEYGVFWKDYRNGNADIYFQRVSAAGSLPGGSESNLSVTSTGGAFYPGAAFAHYGYLVSGAADLGGGDGGANFAQAWGCNYPYAPPCPENLVAYNITGTAATVSWLPAVDSTADIAYYLVFRNNAQVGQTSSTYFSDYGLSPSVVYNYAIRTVNAADYQSTNCGAASTIYVTPNANLVLKLNKSGNDADMNWTGGIGSSHNVWRGTSPQVMTQIGTGSATYSDKNALVNPTVYYYSVDEPGR